MAIAAAPDLNLDGFNDVVVGAPLEENGQGAIYIYNGDAKSIRKQSSQVEPLEPEPDIWTNCWHVKWKWKPRIKLKMILLAAKILHGHSLAKESM